MMPLGAYSSYFSGWFQHMPSQEARSTGPDFRVRVLCRRSGVGSGFFFEKDTQKSCIWPGQECRVSLHCWICWSAQKQASCELVYESARPNKSNIHAHQDSKSEGVPVWSLTVSNG